MLGASLGPLKPLPNSLERLGEPLLVWALQNVEETRIRVVE